VKDGRILAVGSQAAINSYRGTATVDFNLAGRAMLPGFVDSHGHVAIGGLQAYSANLLAQGLGHGQREHGRPQAHHLWLRL
jgi:predicted amidohydrolase YtcJ